MLFTLIRRLKEILETKFNNIFSKNKSLKPLLKNNKVLLGEKVQYDEIHNDLVLLSSFKYAAII